MLTFFNESSTKVTSINYIRTTLDGALKLALTRVL